MKWISVTESLPEKYEWVVVWGIPGKCEVCGTDGSTYEYNFSHISYDEGWVYGEYSCKIEVTHWFKPEDPFKDENRSNA